MAKITIKRTIEIDSVLTDPTSVKLSDPTSMFGVKRNDTDEVIVTDDVAMVRESLGRYYYEFTPPISGLTYTAYVEIVYGGETYHFEELIVDSDLASARVTEAEVRAIGNFPSTLNIAAFINTATMVVDKVAECAGTSVTDAQLKELEKWLSAHYVAIIHPQLASKSIGGASTSWQRGQISTGIEATAFGQQALALDHSGCLKDLTDNRKPASVVWMGQVNPTDSQL